MNSTVVIIAGPPGVGKTAVAAGFAEQCPRAAHLNAAHCWGSIVSGAVSPFHPDSEAQNHTVMDVVAGAAFTFARGGYLVAVDGPVGPSMLDHFRTQIWQHPEIRVHYLVLRPSREIAVARGQNRIATDPLTWQRPVAQLWREFAQLDGLEPHVLDNSCESVEETIGRVADAVAAHRCLLPF